MLNISQPSRISLLIIRHTKGEGMRKTQQHRKANVDRLEKKYVKRVQLHAFKRENKTIKQELHAMQGMNLGRLQDGDSGFFEMPDYRAAYS